VLPQERPLRVDPALPWAEQVDEALGLFVGVGPPQRFDADLAAQRDGLDRLVITGRDADAR
jgi:hypothetical protein